ncbi:thiol reductant ABC exporter subunit CydC [Acidisoma sp. C75]
MSDFLRLLRLLGRGWRAQALGVLLGVLVVLSNVALLALSGWFIAAMGLAGLGLVHIEYFLPAAAIRALAIIRTVCRYLERLTTHDATFRLLSGLRVWFYERLEPLAPAGLQAERSGDLLSRIRADIDSLDNVYLRVLAPSITALVSVILIVLFLSHFSAAIALVDLVALLALGLALPLIAFRLGRPSGRASVTERGMLRADIADTVRGFEELQVFGALDRQFGRHGAAYAKLARLERRQAWLEAAAGGLALVIAQAAVLAAFALAVPLAAARLIPPADIAMLVLLVMASFDAVSGQTAAYQALGETLAAARRLFEIADLPQPVAEPAQTRPLPTRFNIRFSRVSLRYGPDTPWALRGVSFTLAEGGALGVIGPTGSGKTSLVNLLLGFWPFQEGEITIGAVPITALSGEQLRGLCTVITQQSHLFNTSIRENLRIARPDASDAQMRAALAQAEMLEEVDALPEGLSTMVGELGTALSGGQARRIAIARAFLKDAPILLLDEPTEGLDATTEQRVVQALQRLMEGRTTLLISHRPQALRGIAERLRLGRGLPEAPPAGG